jgi:hypothetical protein
MPDKHERARTAKAVLQKILMPVALVAVLGLSACNTGSVADGLAPTAAMTNVPPPPSTGATALAPQSATSTAPETALTPQTAGNSMAAAAPGQAQTKTAALGGSSQAVAFLPVTGAPQSAVTSLAGWMRNAAKAEAVPIVGSVEQGAKYQVKGYFSALNDGSGTILVYVWDVLDREGARVHRISGQERGAKSAGDPWDGIGPEIFNKVAGTTMTSLRSWMATRGAG